MEITTAESTLDNDLLTQQTFCFSQDIPAEDDKMPIITMPRATSGQIIHSKFHYTSSKHKPLPHSANRIEIKTV